MQNHTSEPVFTGAKISRNRAIQMYALPQLGRRNELLFICPSDQARSERLADAG